MSLLDTFRPEEEKDYKQPKGEWQKVQCISYKEDKTTTGKDRVTIDVRTEDGIDIKYAYSVIGGSEYTNANMTSLFYAFGINVNSAIANLTLLKNSWATGYLHKEPNAQGKEYWKVRNWKYTNSKGEMKETWYPSKKKVMQLTEHSEQMGEAFTDDIAPF